MPRAIKLGVAPFAVCRAQASELIRRADRMAQETGQVAPHIEIQPVRAQGETASALFGAAEGVAGHHVEILRRALQRRHVDAVLHHLAERPGAVHCTDLAAVLERGPEQDALLGSRPMRALGAGARVAVGSMRCRALLRHHRPDLQPVHLRGGPGTCIEKLRSAAVDALLLPLAIVVWQDELEAVQEELPSEEYVPAAGQGALALEVRSEESDLMAWAQQLEHPGSRLSVATEIAFTERVGMTLACGVQARLQPDGFEVLAFISGFDGEGLLRERWIRTAPAHAEEASRLGLQLAEEILARRGGPDEQCTSG